jgi:hypothetical protein
MRLFWAVFIAVCTLIGASYHYAGVSGEPAESLTTIDAPDARGLVARAGERKPSLAPVYRVPLRVHLGESGLGETERREVLEEINEIWLAQAGICFAIHIVTHDQVMVTGADLWFSPTVSGYEDLNGYFRDDHEMRVRDWPDLGPAQNPARHPAARTAAHELGHLFGLSHRQNAHDNLMRSKTYGWHLSADEIKEARRTAARKVLSDGSPDRCGLAHAPEP